MIFFFVLPIFYGVIMDGHPIFQSWWIPAHSKYWMPIHYDTIEDGQNKKSHLLSSKFLIQHSFHPISSDVQQCMDKTECSRTEFAVVAVQISNITCENIRNG